MRRSTCFSRFLPLGFCFLVLFNGCLAQLAPCQQQQSPRLRGLRSECQIERLTAREPNRRQVSEAGFSEFWDSGENDGLDCAGVQVVRHTINPKGLLLPYYPSTHELVYVVQGRGIQGTVLSGCPETFETSFPTGGGREEQFFDKHQRVYRYKEGDVLALPAGAVHWTYNDGDTPIVTISLRDTSNVANQLDRNFRKFFLAGNPQSQQLDLGGGRPWTTPPQQHGKTYPSQQPSQRPGQGTGTSQRPTGPYKQPWEIGPSQRPSEGTGPYEQPWGTGPTQSPWGTRPSQRPSKGSGPYKQPWGTSPSQHPSEGTGPSQRPWGSGPYEGTSQRPWETSQRPGQGTGSSQRPGQGTGPYEQPSKTGPSQHPSQGTKPYEEPWETSPSQRPWGIEPSQRPGEGVGPYEQPWETIPSQRPWGSDPSQRPWESSQRPGQGISPGQGIGPFQRPDQGTSPSQYPWGTSQSPGKGTSQRPWGTSQRPGQETSPYEQPSKTTPSQRPDQGTGSGSSSQRPGQGSKPYEQPWETSPSQRPWGTDPSQRPGEGAGPYEQPWETTPSQQPGGISPSKRPSGSSQHPGHGTSSSQRPGQETDPSEYPWGTSQRPGEGTSHRPGQGTGSSHGPGQGTGPYQQPSKTGPSQQPDSGGSTQRPGQGTGHYEQPWETRPSQRPWGTEPSQTPEAGTSPSQRPWGSSERPSQGTSPSEYPWGTSQRPSEGTRPAQGTGSSKKPWGPSERPGEGTRPSELPWGTSKRPDQGTGSSERPWGTGSTEQPWGPSKRPWGYEPSQRPIEMQEDPCEVCRRIRGELGLGDPCTKYNQMEIQQEQEGFNMFSGFDNEILQEAFNVEYDTIWKLQGQNDDRGLIVHAENFQVNVPGEREQEQERFSHQGIGGSGRNNSIGQTICATQLSANIASPALADVYNPRGGRISSLNSHKLPILNLLQLSAERGVLYKNAVLAPHYNLNAHSIIYVTSGNSRLQIVRNDGSSVFDDVVREGQLIVVPQDFAVVKKAGEQGCEWVAFKTNDNAMTTQLAGRFSFIQSLPQDVVANSYDISREQAKNLKYNRQEGVVLSPSRTSRSTMKKKAKNALLNALFG